MKSPSQLFFYVNSLRASFLITPVALAGFDFCLRMLMTVLGQRFPDIHYVVEATLIVAPS